MYVIAASQLASSSSAEIINGKKHGSIPDESYKGQRSFKG
jgi:hypothetical protein